MKLYTKQSSNLIFTVKEKSDVSDLIEVNNVIDSLKKKSITWCDQLEDDDFNLVFIEDDYLDDRISSHVDIVPGSQAQSYKMVDF